MDALSVAESVSIFQFVLIGGLATWMTISAFNNVIAFRGGVGAISHLMSMEMLRQPPMQDSPLLSRAVKGAGWHRAVFTVRFAYYIHQEELAISHEAMIGLTIGAAIFCNVAGR